MGDDHTCLHSPLIVRRDTSRRMADSPSYRRIQHIRMSMLHFIRCLEDYVITNVFHASWHAFIEDVRDNVRHLDDLIRVHQEYLDVVATQYVKSLWLLFLLTFEVYLRRGSLW